MAVLIWGSFHEAYGCAQQSEQEHDDSAGERRDLMPWAFIGFNNIIVNYVTMAPLYKDMLGVDLFSEESSRKQVEFISYADQCSVGTGIKIRH